VRSLVAHAAAGVHQQIGLEIGFFLEFLDVIAIGLAVDAPVNVANLVAGIILAMLGNSTLKPLYGLLWTPVRKPSTTVRATIDSRPYFDRAVGSNWMDGGI
jgi:hypothetical protein